MFLAGVHGVAATTPKGRTLHTLVTGGCALLTAHTNADQASGGVSEALALALGLTDLAPILPAEDGASTGTGRIGTVAPTTLRDFAEHVAAALPSDRARRAGVRRPRPARTTRGACAAERATSCSTGWPRRTSTSTSPATCGTTARGSSVEHDGPALVDVAHWAAEWTWLPVVRGPTPRARWAIG